MSGNDDQESGFPLSIFLVRFLAAAALVLLTYNPTRYCFVAWLQGAMASGNAGAIHALAGVVLLIGWTVFLRTAWASLGMVGMILSGALIAVIVWVLIDFELLSIESGSAITWVVLIGVAALLAIGMSWGHWKRRASGQVAVNEIER